MNPINQMTMNQMAMARYGLQPNPASYVHPAQAGYAAAALIHGQGTRKNATRESTQQLKMWLNEHQKNPYPTKAEKVMLAILSGMTLTQVSTWFANARRRLKKENKWSPDGSCDDGSDAGDSSSLPDSAAQSSASRLPSTQPSTLPDESGYSSSDRDAGSPHPNAKPETVKPETSPSAAQVVTIPSRPPVVAPDMSHHLAHLHPYAAAAFAAQAQAHPHALAMTHMMSHQQQQQLTKETTNPIMPRFIPSAQSTSSISPPKTKRAARSLWSIADITDDKTEDNEEVDVTA